MRKKIELAGVRFGRLVVIEDALTRTSKGEVFWLCKCDCGKNAVVRGQFLRNGTTKSCGCLASELSSDRAKLRKQAKNKCKVNGCDCTTEKGGNGYCGKHAQRYRRHGDCEHVTCENDRRLHNRNAQIIRKDAGQNTYKKYFGRHEHRVIAEKAIGRKLSSIEHVHHIDGNKHNNLPENLQIMNPRDHAKLHANQRKCKK